MILPQTVNPWLGTIGVLAIHPLQGAGSVRALATIRIGASLTISGVKVIQQPGQAAGVKLPDRQDPDGGWHPVVTADDRLLRAAITSAVLAAWHTAEAVEGGT